MIEPKESFELLYAALRQLQGNFFDTAFKVTASLLLVIGWMANSDKTLPFLKNHFKIAVFSAACILFCSFMYVLFAARMYFISSRTATALDALRYAPRNYYGDLVISCSAVWLFMVINIAISLVAVAMIFSKAPAVK